MDNLLKSSLILALLTTCLSVFAMNETQSQSKNADKKYGGFLELEIDRLTERNDSYKMLYQGKEVGSAKMTVQKAKGSWRFIDHTIVESMFIWETTVSTASDKDLSPIRTMAAGLMGGQIANVDIRWKDQLITGHSVMPRQATLPQGKIEVDRELPTGTIDRSASFILAPLMPFDRKKPFHFKWYNSFEDRVRDITFSFVSEEKITVPAGTFNTVKVKMMGGEPSQVLYLTNDEKRRLVKIEIVGVPFVYELMK